jgi:tRNA pseudouridine38-40 synthase
VHARGQVVHFDTQAPRSTRAWLLGTNTHLPRDISLRWVLGVPGRLSMPASAHWRAAIVT